jgi:hypothetical protein
VTDLLMDDLVTLYNGSTPAPARRLAAFDPTGSAQIQIRLGVTIDRPNGSVAGIGALCSRTDIDSAPSSRGGDVNSDCFP